jgi:hypothetical protein
MGALGSSGGAARVPPSTQAFIEAHCASCHDDVEKKGGLDLTALGLRPEDPKNFAAWVKVHDRVRAGEMPPRKKARPAAGEIESFVTTLAGPLRAAEEAAEAGQGRATQRRLNRHEYENAVRDLLGAPWLQIRDGLPEDGEAHRFNKIGDALDLSHVNLARYLAVADEALRQVLAHQVERPETKVTRCFAREQRSFSGRMIYSVFNTRAERATFPVLGTQAQPDVRSTTQPITVAAADPATRELEAMGVVASSYEPIELRFERFKAPQSGRYKVRVSAYSVWVGPGKAYRWWIPNFDDESPGRRPEPLTFYAEMPPRQLRRLGAYDVGTEPTTGELDVFLLEGETIRPDAVRFFRSRPSNWVNPLATREGQPGVAFRWLEVEGPLLEGWPSAGHRLMFGDLPLRKKPGAGGVEVVTKEPARSTTTRSRRGWRSSSGIRPPTRSCERSRLAGNYVARACCGRRPNACSRTRRPASSWTRFSIAGSTCGKSRRPRRIRRSQVHFAPPSAASTSVSGTATPRNHWMRFSFQRATIQLAPSRATKPYCTTPGRVSEPRRPSAETAFDWKRSMMRAVPPSTLTGVPVRRVAAS